jgi:hypothetical protein
MFFCVHFFACKRLQNGESASNDISTSFQPSASRSGLPDLRAGERHLEMILVGIRGPKALGDSYSMGTRGSTFDPDTGPGPDPDPDQEGNPAPRWPG